MNEPAVILAAGPRMVDRIGVLSLQHHGPVELEISDSTAPRLLGNSPIYENCACESGLVRGSDTAHPN